jgi:DNA-binding transcriptional regulator GbsR (MarR family)
MTRETSKAAYQAIMSNGTLSQRRRDVYDILYKHGPLSASEVCQHLSLPRDSVSPRLSELQRLSIVKEFGTKTCGITGQTVTAWDVTASLPRGSLKAKPRRRWILALNKEKIQVFSARNEAKNYAKKNRSTLIEVVECKSKPAKEESKTKAAASKPEAKAPASKAKAKKYSKNTAAKKSAKKPLKAKRQYKKSAKARA